MGMFCQIVERMYIEGILKEPRSPLTCLVRRFNVKSMSVV